MTVPAGILALDKPAGPTSHDLVAHTRRALGTRRVGHAGTLDPMASGLLILGVESATRLLTYLVGLDKEYTATIRLGEGTDTDDAEGEVVSSADASGVSRERIDAGIAALTGDLSQIPSAYSAVKVGGRKAYDRARAGETVELAPRAVRVAAFDVLDERRSGAVVDLDVRVTVSSGTYVRALARDLGADLGTGGHLVALRRTRIGPFAVEEAVSPDDDLAAALLRSGDAAARVLPVVPLGPAAAADLAHGRRPVVDAPDAETAAALGPDGRLVAIVSVARGVARVLVGFPEAPA